MLHRFRKTRDVSSNGFMLNIVLEQLHDFWAEVDLFAYFIL